MAATRTKRGTGRGRTTARSNREAPESIEEQIVDVHITDLADHNESINILIHGPSGHGKTVLAGGAPNAVFLSTEKGVVSAQRAGSQAKLIRTPHWEHVVAGKKLCDQQLGPDDWVIIDSLTKMQTLQVRWILRTAHEGNERRDLDIPAIQDYQKWQNYFKRFVDELIDAPYNCIFITTDMIKENEDGEDIVLPNIEGKNFAICNYVREQMDVVTYYRSYTNKSDKVIRRARFQPKDPYIACKDRYNVFGPYQEIDDGEYTAMAEFIEMIQDSEAA